MEDWKIRLEHYTPEKVGESTSIESPAMCSDCVDAKVKGYKKFLNGKHFDLGGKLLLNHKQQIQSLNLDICELENKQKDVQKELNKKRELLAVQLK